MGKVLLAIVMLVIGAVGGGVVALSLGGGMMAGAGVATGLSAGICSTVTAAGALGYLSDDQVDEVLARAAQDVSGDVEVPEGAEIVGSAAQCAAFMQTLKSQSSM